MLGLVEAVGARNKATMTAGPCCISRAGSRGGAGAGGGGGGGEQGDG